MNQNDSSYLDSVRVASPCRAAWDEMAGGAQVRSCARCQKKVYNLSHMTAADAAALVREAEGKSLCVRFYRRSDGTVMTADCPVGKQAGQKKVARGVAAVAGSVLAFAGLHQLRSAATPSDDMATVDTTCQVTVTGDAPMVAAPPLPIQEVTAPDDHGGEWVAGGISKRSPTLEDTQPVMGEVSSLPHGDSPTLNDKPFLRDLPVDNTPRDDPFAPHKTVKGRP